MAVQAGSLPWPPSSGEGGAGWEVLPLDPGRSVLDAGRSALERSDLEATVNQSQPPRAEEVGDGHHLSCSRPWSSQPRRETHSSRYGTRCPAPGTCRPGSARRCLHTGPRSGMKRRSPVAGQYNGQDTRPAASASAWIRQDTASTRTTAAESRRSSPTRSERPAHPLPAPARTRHAHGHGDPVHEHAPPPDPVDTVR